VARTPGALGSRFAWVNAARASLGEAVNKASTASRDTANLVHADLEPPSVPVIL
jgi:hypothetical protein